MHVITTGLVQPQTCVCCSPKIARPTPLAISARPRKSSRPGLVWVCGRAMAVSTRAMMATGTLTQKMARQVHSLRYPPRIGPMAVRPPDTPKKIARARPRSRTGNAATTMASAAGYMIAPPMP